MYLYIEEETYTYPFVQHTDSYITNRTPRAKFLDFPPISAEPASMCVRAWACVCVFLCVCVSVCERESPIVR